MTEKANPMREIRIEKLTLNIGAGKNMDTLEKGMALIKLLTGIDPIKTYAKKRIPAWGLRPGLPIGCKLTLRGKQARDLLVRLFKARDNKLKPTQIDQHGNIAFGIHEYIDIPDIKYSPDIGIMGLQVCVSLTRPGYRIKNRRIQRRSLTKRHKIMREEAVAFVQNQFNVTVAQEV